jgi:hypothetical protein
MNFSRSATIHVARVFASGTSPRARRLCAGLVLVATLGGANLLNASAAIAESAPVTTYAQRQVIRDQYRGRIDELTFNDELSDGVSVSQALADAIAAQTQSPRGTKP